MAEKKKEESKEFLVVIEKTKDLRMKIFSARKRFTSEEEFYSNPKEVVAEFIDYDGKRHNNEGYLLAEELFKINGIDTILIDNYDVTITIGRAFKWDEVREDIIVSVIKRHLTLHILTNSRNKDI